MLRRISLGLALLLLAACGSYDFTVNDKVVYTPKPLFTAFDVADEALRECVSQAIIDGNITAAAQLQDLNCSHAGITDLQGIAVFTALQRLKLSANGIEGLAPLAALSTLEVLYLDDNKVTDPVPLFELTALRTLDLSGNDNLQCPGNNSLLLVEQVALPEHCTK